MELMVSKQWSVVTGYTHRLAYKQAQPLQFIGSEFVALRDKGRIITR
jgi:hypothetical protein